MAEIILSQAEKAFIHHGVEVDINLFFKVVLLVTELTFVLYRTIFE